MPYCTNDAWGMQALCTNYFCRPRRSVNPGVTQRRRAASRAGHVEGMREQGSGRGHGIGTMSLNLGSSLTHYRNLPRRL
jgi:hypothetical protein